MRGWWFLLLVIAGMVVLFSGCATPWEVRNEALRAYQKGLRVGRVIGRDEVIYELKSPDCWQQPVDELMNPNSIDTDQTAKKPTEKLQRREVEIGVHQ